MTPNIPLVKRKIDQISNKESADSNQAGVLVYNYDDVPIGVYRDTLNKANFMGKFIAQIQVPPPTAVEDIATGGGSVSYFIGKYDTEEEALSAYYMVCIVCYLYS